jgi:hypothetical protein
MIHKKWVIDAYTTKITTTGKSLSEILFFWNAWGVHGNRFPNKSLELILIKL